MNPLDVHAPRPEHRDRASKSSAGGDGDENSRPVGEVLRQVRKGRGLTLKGVAEQAGVSESFLSQLERGNVGASLKTLQGIAAAMGLTMGDLFDTDEPGSARLIRRRASADVSIGTMSKRRLTPGSAAHLEVIAAHFEPNGSTGEKPYVHGDSEELCVVVAGRVRVEVGDESYELEVGDSLFYRSSLPHAFQALGEEEAEVLWIIGPPSY